MSVQNDVIRIISVVNQKGGVGKTTTVVNLAAVLAATGKRVLVIDIDPQGNSSTSFGIDLAKRKFTIYDVLLGRVSMAKAVLNTDVPKLDLISSSIDLVAVESEFHDVPKKEIIIKEKLKEIYLNYDFIFFDCPPSLGLLTINALAASHSVMIPVQCEFLALEGMAYLLNTVKLIKGSLNKNLKICFVFHQELTHTVLLYNYSTLPQQLGTRKMLVLYS